jgi:hypothetical protein
MNHIVYELRGLLDKYRHEPHIEIELRLGWKSRQRFDTNIGKNYSDMIYNILSPTPFKRTDETTHVYVHNNVRVITDAHTGTPLVCQKKRKIEIHDILLHGTPFDLRVSVCQELPVPLPPSYKFLRSRERTTWKYKTWSYDLTHARSANPREESAETLDSYEFELELDLAQANREQLTSQYIAHSTVMKVFDLLYISNPADESLVTQIEHVEKIKNNLKDTCYTKYNTTYTTTNTNVQQNPKRTKLETQPILSETT